MERWPRHPSGCSSGVTTSGCSWTRESRLAKSACGVPSGPRPRPFGCSCSAWVCSFPCCLHSLSSLMTPTLQDQPYRIPCASIWGGIQPASLDVCTLGITASLHSTASGGQRGCRAKIKGEVRSAWLDLIDSILARNIAKLSMARAIGEGADNFAKYLRAP